jgi:hypothetical protein
VVEASFPLADAVRQLGQRAWDSDALQEHADRYAEARFVARLREIVAEEAAISGGSSAD